MSSSKRAEEVFAAAEFDAMLHASDRSMTEEWDWAKAVRKKPTKAPRPILSVAFSVEEFSLVSQAAEKLGSYTSSFVRAAALKAAGEVLD